MTRSFALLAGVTLCTLSACQQADTGSTNGAYNAAVAVQPAASLAELLNTGGDARLLAAVRAAGLEETLKGPGPYTLLVPSDAALAALPPASLQAAQPQAKAELTRLLSYHVLPGVVLTEDIGRAIDNGGGKAVLATMAGPTLTASRKGGEVVLTDASGKAVALASGDQQAKNGVAHRIDGVLTPGNARAAAAN